MSCRMNRLWIQFGARFTVGSCSVFSVTVQSSECWHCATLCVIIALSKGLTVCISEQSWRWPGFPKRWLRDVNLKRPPELKPAVFILGVENRNCIVLRNVGIYGWIISKPRIQQTKPVVSFFWIEDRGSNSFRNVSHHLNTQAP
jgi:hypothetical protein